MAVAAEADTSTVLEKLGIEHPDSSCSLLGSAKERFLQLAEGFRFLNPHLTLSVDWRGEGFDVSARSPDWKKWSPSEPTPPCWYDLDRFERLIAAYIAGDADSGRDRTVREFIAEFRGLSGTRKQKAVLKACGLSRTKLFELATENGIDRDIARQLLDAMKDQTRPVIPTHLGVIGQEHLAAQFKRVGADMETFAYRKKQGQLDDVPWVLEAAFAWCPNAEERRIVTGINWSPCVVNPFRSLGPFGTSLDSILEDQRVGVGEPVVLVLHLAYPRVEFADRGKTTLVLRR